MFRPFTLNINGNLVAIDRPQVMGIVNVTPDSFYAGSRYGDEIALEERVRAMVDEGVDILDIGGYSSRPGAAWVSPEEEWRRLNMGLKAAVKAAPRVLLSIDTFRAEIAAKAIDNYGSVIVNDISGGGLDPQMWNVVAEKRVPYVLMHMRGTPETMQTLADYTDVTADVIGDLSEKLRELRLRGVADVIVDPGFGFSKTTEQNYRMMRNLDLFSEALEAPVLVGISRKSMITRLLGITPAEALPGTVALNTIALAKGAAILRVHDVKAAVEGLKVYLYTMNPNVL